LFFFEAVFVVWTPESALHFLKSKSGKLFDPELVGIFLDMDETLDAIKRNFSE